MTVTISGTEYCYPDFKEGQVLSHNDLNTLRDYLYTKLAFHGRALIGFGVACGLDGTVAGSSLALTKGFALGQGGRELIASNPATPRHTLTRPRRKALPWVSVMTTPTRPPTAALTADWMRRAERSESTGSSTAVPSAVFDVSMPAFAQMNP